jgi:hypothetical protein
MNADLAREIEVCFTFTQRSRQQRRTGELLVDTTANIARALHRIAAALEHLADLHVANREQPLPDEQKAAEDDVLVC